MNALYQMRMINTSRVGCNPPVLEVNKEINITLQTMDTCSMHDVCYTV